MSRSRNLQNIILTLVEYSLKSPSPCLFAVPQAAALTKSWYAYFSVMRARYQQNPVDPSSLTCDRMVAIKVTSRDRSAESRLMKVGLTFCCITAVVFGFCAVNRNSLAGTKILSEATLSLLNSKLTAEDDAQCRFYLAESAVPHGGFGLYTAIDIKEGEFAQSMPDICIYVADTPEGTAFETHSWRSYIFDGTFEGRNPRAACEGFATL
jgi:hypothetical protein